MQGDGPRLSSRPWNNEYDGFAKSFFAKKERFQLLIRVFDIAPYNMEGALLPEYESGSLYGMGGSQFRTEWLSANGILTPVGSTEWLYCLWIFTVKCSLFKCICSAKKIMYTFEISYKKLKVSKKEI